MKFTLQVNVLKNGKGGSIMKKKSLIAAVMVLVLLCASSACVALANGWCDHDATIQYEERFTTVSEEACGNGDATCTVTYTYTWYDIWCPKCLQDVGYAEYETWEHTGEQCKPKIEERYREYLDI